MLKYIIFWLFWFEKFEYQILDTKSMSVILINLNLEIIYSLENSFGFESLFFGDLNFGMLNSSLNLSFQRGRILYYVQRYRFMLVQECKSKNICEG